MKETDTEHMVTITAVAHGGDGICRIDGQVCFVPYGLPGDVLRIRVTGKSRGVLWGKLEEVVEPSPDRLERTDDHPEDCGGCLWRHFAYPAQGVWKKRFVSESLARIAGIETEPEWVENADLRTGYRTRAQFHAGQEGIGYFAVNSHRVVPIESCPLCHARLNEVLKRLHAGQTRTEVEAVVNPESAEALVWSRKPDKMLRAAFPEVESPGNPPRPSQFLFDGIPIVNSAFSQSSLLLNRMLVREVHERIGEPDRLLDLYCGNGNFSLTSRAKNILGIDHDRAATRAANQIGHGEYRPSDEAGFVKALRDPWDVVVLDPPRTGAKAITPALAACSAPVIVYVSCDPATLARDLKMLIAQAWRVASVVAVDMFPNTPHVETVCRLERG